MTTLEQIKDAIKTAKLKKTKIAAHAGIDASTLHRTLTGEVELTKAKELAIVQSINTLAGQIVLGNSGADELVRLFNDLPSSVQADVLMLVRAYHENYGIEEIGQA